MANEFNYNACLSINHPTIDARLISKALSSYLPIVEATAGSVACHANGSPYLPIRKSVQSYWLAQLHQEKLLYSGETDLSVFLEQHINLLSDHAEFIQNILNEGRVVFKIALYHITKYLAYEIESCVLAKVGAFGIGIEIHSFICNIETM